MSENRTIKNITTADIEKYWKNELSPARMHEIEKAAMDDPFLADALEGYKYSADTERELNIIREKFNKKYEDTTPVIPFYRRKNGWLRIAAAIIVLAGTGLFIQQLVLNSNTGKESIANFEEKNQQKSPEAVINTTANPANDKLTPAASTTKTPDNPVTLTDQQKQKADKSANNSFITTTTDTNKTIEKQLADDNIATELALQKKEVVISSGADKKDTKADKQSAAGIISSAPSSPDNESANAAMRANAFRKENKQNISLNNSFNYRVVDAQNNPVPFANITNTRDNIGTYTDVRGYFNLMSSDSVLDVQIRSLGYDSESYRLTPSKQANNLVLKEDAVARENMMDLNQGRSRVMSSASRRDSAEVEEPVVGWGNYNTYVENNIKIPENIRAKNSFNEVELSFDVDRGGQPVNIKVTRSSQCKACDEEAIRLLKEGPKWKQRGKRSKTTISINVNK